PNLEATVAVDIKSGHATGFARAQVKTRDSGVRGGCRPKTVGLSANAIAIETEPEVSNQRSPQRVGVPERDALIPRRGSTGECRAGESGPACQVAKSSGCVFGEITDSVTPNRTGK